MSGPEKPMTAIKPKCKVCGAKSEETPCKGCIERYENTMTLSLALLAMQEMAEETVH